MSPMRRRNKKIDIAGAVYEVIFTDDEECEELEGRYGYTDLDRKIIVIRKTDSIETQQDTMVHEIAHAFCQEVGLKAFFDLSLPAKTDRYDWEESFISIIAPHIVGLIKKNKRKLWLLK